MSEKHLPRILCVDDEPRVVDAMVLVLRKEYEVHTACGGAEALQKLENLDGIAVVVSDMRMPGMDGATLLHQVMQLYPESSRILLTGDPGRDVAVQAINQGRILQFLSKPCPPDKLKAAIEEGIVRYRVVCAERALMQETLIGCIQTLVDVLALTSPIAFGRATRVRALAMTLAQQIGMSGFWQLDAAAMLSQLGYVSLPAELVEKLYYGAALTDAETKLASGVSAVTAKLLAHIPNLEPVLQILDALDPAKDLRKLGEGTIGSGARILTLVLDYDALTAQGHVSDVAIQTLRSRSARYGSTIFERFSQQLGAASGAAEIRLIPLHLVRPGMTFVDDLRTSSGALLVPRGFVVTRSFIERIRSLGPEMAAEKLKMLVPPTSEEEAGASLSYESMA
jgi:response regulator RpfG family c-di-GMP phosphodiesterase